MRLRATILAAAGLSAACAEPSVDALAVWLEGSTATKFELYDGGERRSLPFRAKVEGSDPSKLQVVVVPGGRGFVVLPQNDTMVWLDANDGGYVEVEAEAEWGKLASEMELVESGIAATRWNSAQTGMVILPTVRGHRAPIWFERPEHYLGVQLSLRSPPESDVLWAIPPPFGDEPTTVVVYEMTRPGAKTPALVELERAQLRWRPPLAGSGSFIPNRCENGACLTPDGSALVAMRGQFEASQACIDYGVACPPQPTCWAVRYRWQGPLDGRERIEQLRLPDDCDFDHDDLPETPEVPREGLLDIIAALSEDVIVLMDSNLRIYRADLAAGTWLSLPRIGPVDLASDSQLAPRMQLHVAEGGRAVLLVAENLQVIRADAQGLRIHSGEQLACSEIDSLVVSPGGEWLLAMCEVAITEGLDGDDDPLRTVVRISPLGLEQYPGISMRPLAIDDGGNALLYSFASGDNDQEPRGLFVLDAQGRLSRIDALEPAPLELTPGSAPSYYFSARPRLE